MFTGSPSFGQNYWILADWTGSGALKVQECIWRGDYLDRKRERSKSLYTTKTSAHAALKNL